jgi:hypothetical protein
MYPDGSCSITNYDLNGRLLRTRDRREISSFRSYNQADLETQRIGFGSRTLTIDTLHTHHGPARVTHSEFVESQLEMGVKATSAGGWSQELILNPQNHPGGSDTDAFNRVAVLEGASAKLILEGSFLGLPGKIRYGTSTAREVAYGYDGLLRAQRLVSNEATPALNVEMSRDLVGNVLTRESSNYSYDGMHRMIIGETETYAYDELSNLSRRGTQTYTYQPAARPRGVAQSSRLSGTFPPFSASLRSTALCRAMFCSALPCSPACTFNSAASFLRAARLESMPRSFSRSTIDTL